MTLRSDLPWKLESVRLSIFVDDLPSSIGDAWWEQITGADADEITAKRVLGDVTSQGPWLNNRLVLNRNSLSKRIDWLLQPMPTVEDGFPALGSFDEWRNKFAELMAPWLDNVELGITRVAYGAILLVPVSERAEGYQFLREALPMISFQDDWSDFTFQVNKRRKLDVLADSKFPDLELNCLSKWSSVELRLIPTDISIGPPPPAYAGRLELDLNSAGEDREIKDLETVRLIFKAINEIAVRFTNEGCLS